MKNKKTKKASAIQTGLAVSIVITMLTMALLVPYSPTNIPNIPQNQQMSWHTIYEGDITAFAEYALAAGTAGILEVFLVNNTASPNSTYSVNDSTTIEGWCTAAGLGYSSADDFYTELTHSVAFDIVVRVRANRTVCANSTDEYCVFNGARLRVNISSADLTLGTLTPLIRVETYNISGADYFYANYWINWTGGTYTPVAEGFQLSADTSYAITEIRFEAYY